MPGESRAAGRVQRPDQLSDLSRTIDRVAAGTSNLEITLPKRAEKWGLVSRGGQPFPQAIVIARYADGEQSQAITDANGQFALAVRPDETFTLIVAPPVAPRKPGPATLNPDRVELANQSPGGDPVRVVLP